MPSHSGFRNKTKLGIAKPKWTVQRIVFAGAVRDISDDFLNVLRFRADLRSDKLSSEIEVRDDALALVKLFKTIAPGAIHTPRTITKVIEGLLAAALSSPNCSFDPARVSQWDWEKQKWPASSQKKDGDTTMMDLSPGEADDRSKNADSLASRSSTGQ